MNTFLLTVLCLLGTWASLAGGVTVQDGDFSFSLESVKKLKDLQDFQQSWIGHRRKPAVRAAGGMAGPAVPVLCSHPQFPTELQPVCKKPNAQEILQRLEAIAEDPSMCEICAYAACAGC
ncbi:PREDICTED: guanylin [Elephantulus edwardii]|uniref:guanylin n=1 Tax=Elephantulus edwardii TaxID=28737 RepID=UPI0003F0E95D|nr:PREDICTED: guanylin [Elephantulus edwardii]